MTVLLWCPHAPSLVELLEHSTTPEFSEYLATDGVVDLIVESLEDVVNDEVRCTAMSLMGFAHS